VRRHSDNERRWINISNSNKKIAYSMMESDATKSPKNEEEREKLNIQIERV
jgi:hypothetical protein